MSDQNSSRPAYLSAFLALCGFALSLIALYHHTALNNHLDVGPSSFCNISATVNCDAVNRSAWSYLFGIPIASYGIFFYGLVLLFSFISEGSAVLALSAVAVLGSVALFLISKFLIGALCPVCLSLYAVNIILFFVNYIRDRQRNFLARFSESTASIFNTVITGNSRGVIVLTFILLAYTAYTASDIMLVRVLLPFALTQSEQHHNHDPKQAVQKTLEEWRNATPVSLSTSSENSSATGDYSRGTAGAPIEMVEFSDFECPFCRKFSFEIDPLLHDYNGKLHFVFRNFPLDQSCNPSIPREMHKNSCHAAKFARCAGEQGKFWQALSYLFTLPEFDNNSSKQETAAAIDRGVDKLALDRDAMNECQTSGRTNEKISQDINDALQAGIEGTPFVIINHKVVKFPTPAAVRAIFDSILQ